LPADPAGGVNTAEDRSRSVALRWRGHGSSAAVTRPSPPCNRRVASAGEDYVMWNPDFSFPLTEGRSEDSLRIALVTETFPPEVNGVAMTLGRTVAGLLQRGHRVQLVRPRQHRLDQACQDGALAEILVGGIPIPRYPGLRFGMPARSLLQRLWAKAPPDIVHVATEGPLGSSAIAAARFLGLPVSSSFHTHFAAYCHHYGLGWLRGIIAGHLRRFHNRTDATFVPTHGLAQSLAQDGFRNLIVLSRGVDTRLFHPGRRSPRLRAAWGVDEHTLVVACVGRMAAEKNLSLALTAFDALRARVAQTRLVFVGDGPLRAAMQRRHPQHIYAGMRHGEDLAEHYASADLFLFPSLTETFGNVTTEALASGLAVVAYDHAAAADLIQDGINGRLVPAGDEAAFCQTASALAADASQLQRLRLAAAGSVARLDWERIHDGFTAILGDIVAAHGRRSSNPFAIVPD